uniref:Odorant binding protein C04c n=1 Tax=Anthonomus eugenii TaxID=122869 RepID=A0AA96C9N3_9CUCU|nr:odorant binding protein C04c [Anthonomus eugenii]
MKVFFAAVFLIALVQVKSLSDKQKELLAQHYKQCIDKSKVDQAILQKARVGNFADDPKLKEHVLCITEKIGFQNAQGVLQIPVIESKLKEALKGDEAKAKQLIKACAIANSDKKLQAFNALKCVYQKANINLL